MKVLKVAKFVAKAYLALWLAESVYIALGVTFGKVTDKDDYESFGQSIISGAEAKGEALEEATEGWRKLYKDCF